jgi:leucyl-tRNA synthetase
MVIADTYFRKEGEGKETFYAAQDVTVELDAKGAVVSAALKSDGQPVSVKLEKMSKSKNNGIDPQSMIDKFGADTVRLFTMFAAPPDQSLEWNDDAIAGSSRFMRRLWNLFNNEAARLQALPLQAFDNSAKVEQGKLNKVAKELRLITHTITERVLRDYERQQFNTVVAAAMELTNAVEKADWAAMGDAGNAVFSEACYTLVKILAPVTPHLAENLWSTFAPSGSTLEDQWLELDESALVKDEVSYVVQVNGKLRGKIEVSASTTKESIEEIALAEENVRRFLEGLTVRKVIVVPAKLVNIVAN